MNNKNNARKKGIFGGLTFATAVTLVVLCIVGGTLAYFFTKTPNIVNTFVPGKVECEVTEKFDGVDKSEIAVLNKGSTAAYIRVGMASYWKAADAEDGIILGKDSVLPYSGFESILNDDWVIGSDGYFYYTKAVAPEGSTPHLFKQQITLRSDENGNVEVLEIFAEAIQCAPIDAVTEAWGNATGSNNGSVTGVNDGVLQVTEMTFS